MTIFVGFQRSRDTPNLNNLPQLSFIRFQWNVFEHKCLGCPGNMIPQDLIFTKKKYGAIPSVEGNTLASKSSSPGIDSFFSKKWCAGGLLTESISQVKTQSRFGCSARFPPRPPISMLKTMSPQEKRRRDWRKVFCRCPTQIQTTLKLGGEGGPERGSKQLPPWWNPDFSYD